MPRKPSREAVEQENRELRSKESACASLLQAVESGEKPDAVETIHEGGDRTTLKLYRSCRAHGGLLLTVDKIKEQAPNVEAHVFDDYARRVTELAYTEHTTPLKNAVDRLHAARNKACGLGRYRRRRRR